MNQADEYQNLARTQARAQFVELCQHPFLIGAQQLSRPHQPGKTVLMSPTHRAALMSPRSKRSSSESDLLVLAIKKVQEAFPSMITVGRTSNNDVVVEDVQVSKFHAFFRVTPEAIELADAGSRNGTFVGKIRLESKGPPRQVRPGESIRFGHLEFILVDAGSCWDRLH
jgi:hypothetical protein